MNPPTPSPRVRIPKMTQARMIIALRPKRSASTGSVSAPTVSPSVPAPKIGPKGVDRDREVLRHQRRRESDRQRVEAVDECHDQAPGDDADLKAAQLVAVR